MKKVLTVLLSALVVCSVAGCSSEKNSGSSETDSASAANDSASAKGNSVSLEEEEDAFSEIDASKLPSKVDLRDFDGKNYVTPVKTQLFGDCWTFGMAGSAETSYLFANDMGVPAGQVNDKVNFSEKYISCYMFHGITKDDVVKGKVRASQVGDGFDPSEAESTNPISAYIIGGPFVGHANLFGSGFGPVDESVSVKGEYPYAYDDESSVEWSLPVNAEYRNAPVGAFLGSSRVLPSPAMFDEKGNYSLNEAGLTAIKSELSRGHAVSLGVLSQHAGFNPKNHASYYSGEEESDHGVAVIGYDDNYAKENFTKELNGKVIEGTTPPGNGAFIVKNSWGLQNNDGDIDDGFIYLSYYDHGISTPQSYVFCNNDSLRHNELNYDQYDLMMTNWYSVADHDSETKTANIFDAEEDENLFQIAYMTGSPKTEVAYEIYKGVENDDPSSGELLEKGVSRHRYAGYQRVDIENEYELKKGEKYSVVLTTKRVTDDKGSMTYTEFFPYSTEFFEGMTVNGQINKGESFLYADGKWKDMTDLKDGLKSTAFEQCVKEYSSKKDGSKLSLESEATFTVDNYPIKAISAPAGK